MELKELIEPDLEFFENQKHICPRYGIGNFSVFDAMKPTRPDRIIVGAIGNDDGLNMFKDFLEWTSGIVETDSENTEQYPTFCGMDTNIGFHTRLVTDNDIQQLIYPSDIKTVKGIGKYNQRVSSAVDLYLERIDYLCSANKIDVIMCIIPDDLYTSIRHNKKNDKGNEDLDKLEAQYKTSAKVVDFRALLKAKSLRYGVPIQIIKSSNLSKEAKGVQNAATRAWNLCTALYFKSHNKAPWKLSPLERQYPTCYLGISFFKSLDGSTLDTSTAQVFDEIGKSVILRGRPASITKEDKSPYLKEENAYSLLKDALKTYKTAVRHPPSRLVIHKTSRFVQEETHGFEAAATEVGIDMLELVSISNSRIRLFRERQYPPLRGTLLKTGKKSSVLYTRGSVPYFKTYPGAFIPEPLEIRIERSEHSLETISREILALTKMNWNNTQFDNKNPITLGCARKVGEVLKYLGDGEQPQPSYAFYM